MGTNLTEFLCQNADKETQIRAMVMENTPINMMEAFQAKYGNLDIVYANLLEKGSLRKATQNITAIVHLAGIVTEWGPKAIYDKIIVEGTQNVLDAAAENGVDRVIFISSLTVHALDGHHYDDESAPRDMRKMYYGIAKRLAEDRVQVWAEADQKRQYGIVRPGFVIYGPHDVGSFVNAIDAIIKGQMAKVNGGKPLISYVYVKNLSYGISQLLFAPQIEGAYNVLDGNMSWKEWYKVWTDAAEVKEVKTSIPYWLIAPIVWVMEKIYKLFRSKHSPVLNMYRISIPRKDIAFINTKIKEKIGYTPPYTLEESVQKTLEDYYKSRP